MRLPIISSVLFAVMISTMPNASSVARDKTDAGAQVTAQAEQNSATRKKRVVDPGPGVQIACTHIGCNPIPRGCHIEKEFGWDGTPTGYDLVVCPFR